MRVEQHHQVRRRIARGAARFLVGCGPPVLIACGSSVLIACGKPGPRGSETAAVAYGNPSAETRAKIREAPALFAEATAETDMDDLADDLRALGETGLMEARFWIDPHFTSPDEDLREGAREGLMAWYEANGLDPQIIEDLDDDEPPPPPPPIAFGFPAAHPTAVWLAIPQQARPVPGPPPAYVPRYRGDVPPGFEERRRPNIALLTTGAASFGAFYGVSVIFAFAADPERPALAVPLVGPFVQLTRESEDRRQNPNPDGPGEESLRRATFTMLGIVQILGVAAAATAFAFPTTHIVRVSPPTAGRPAAVSVRF